MNKLIKGIGFKNGKYISKFRITVHAENPIIGRAYGVYEFFRINKGKAFYLDRHLDRFFNSLRILKLGINYSRKELENIINQVIVKNQQDDFFIKMYAAPQHLTKLNLPADLFLIPVEIPPFPDKIYQNGASLLMKEYTRFLPEAKSTNYLASVYWQDEMDEIGTIDVLFTHNGLVLESSRGNLFMIKDGQVYTPEKNILKGITRSIVMDLMRENNIPYSIRNITTNELFVADEVFITSTTKLVIPIVKINEKTIGSGKPGILTKKILDWYKKLL